MYIWTYKLLNKENINGFHCVSYNDGKLYEL